MFNLKIVDYVRDYVRAKGFGSVMTLAHRVTGITIVGFIMFHIYTLSGLFNPAAFTAKMEMFNNFFCTFGEWALVFPVMFHAFNGTRLMLYEVYGVRKDNLMMGSVFGLLVLYAGVLAWAIIAGFEVIAGLFWGGVVLLSVAVAYVVVKKIWHTRNQLLWKLQRISAAFLLPMVSAHMFFMHMNYNVGHDVATILARMSHIGIQVIDLAFLLTLVFHAGYGLYTIVCDNVAGHWRRFGFAVPICFAMATLVGYGIKLILFV